MIEAHLEDARCAGTGVDMIPDDDDAAGVGAAKRVCSSCPVVAECLRRSASYGLPGGVFGGLTRVERVLWMAGAPVAQCQQCRNRAVLLVGSSGRCITCLPHPGLSDGTADWLDRHKAYVLARLLLKDRVSQIAESLGERPEAITDALRRWQVSSYDLRSADIGVMADRVSSLIRAGASAAEVLGELSLPSALAPRIDRRLRTLRARGRRSRARKTRV